MWRAQAGFAADIMGELRVGMGLEREWTEKDSEF